MDSLATRIGSIVATTTAGETVRAYLPRPLPPNPPLDLTKLVSPLERANRALGRLDGIASILPSTDLFVYMYVRKEALLSSQIEGTQSSLSDLLLLESKEDPLVPLDDVQEVSNYVSAMGHGLRRLDEAFPLSLRLLREVHSELMHGGRGGDKQPGEFRTSQNWIGGTRPGNAMFVPPPPDHLSSCLGDLEKFLHDRDTYPVLIRAALAHVQFETIHPFLDGNGRLGRLLITLMLGEEGALRKPLLYLSLFLKQHRERYYELLQLVRTKGDWESWIDFFLEGVEKTSAQGVATAQRLLTLFAEDEQKITRLKRATASALLVHAALKKSPLLSVPYASQQLGISQPTIQKSLDHLTELQIVREITKRRRHRIYEYASYLSILDEGTEPIKS